MEKYLVVAVENQFKFQNHSTMCCEINDFELNFFSNSLIFSSQADSDNWCEGGGVAKDAGGKEVEQ